MWMAKRTQNMPFLNLSARNSLQVLEWSTPQYTERYFHQVKQTSNVSIMMQHACKVSSMHSCASFSIETILVSLNVQLHNSLLLFFE